MDTNLIQLDTEEANVPTYADNDDDGEDDNSMEEKVMMIWKITM